MKTIFICEKQKKEIKSFHFDEFVRSFKHTGNILLTATVIISLI
jgi:hypothetical protein